MNQIKELRKRLVLTQQEMADRLGTNILTIRRWEKDKTKPSPMARRCIKEVFGVEIKEV